MATAEMTNGEITVVVLTDMSSSYSDTSGRGSVAGAELAVEDFAREHPDIKVRVLNADHQNKADIGAEIVRRWVDTEHVDAVVDVPNTSVALAVNEIMRARDRVFLGSSVASSDLTGPRCAPTTVQWTFDTWALAHATASTVVKRGGGSWFFLTADYAFGYSLEEQTSKFVKSKGGEVKGAVRHPLASTDYSSFLLQAQSSGAKVIGLANAGLDTANSIKQAAEFGIVAGGQRLAALLFTLAEVHGLGLDAAQGLTLTESFYWDRDDKSREFGERFFKRTGRMPNMVHAGTYSGVMQYLKAIEKAGTDATEPVAKAMHELPVDDVFARNAKVGANGRLISDVYLMEVKKPEESSRPWDYYKVLATVPGDEAYIKPADSGCELVGQ